MMRKWLLSAFCLGVLLCAGSVCHAGDVPETLLFYDSAQVYFGEVKDVDGGAITVIQRQNIKGEFTQDKEITYERFTYTEAPEIGVQYLCGFINEDNPLYVWEVTGYHAETLELKRTDGMSQSMQKYLNEGRFAEKEQERLAAKEETRRAEAAADKAKPLDMTGGEAQSPTASPLKKDGQSAALLWFFAGAPLIGAAVWLWRRNRRGV